MLCADVCGSLAFVSSYHAYRAPAASKRAGPGISAPAPTRSSGGWSPWSVVSSGWHDVVHAGDVVRHEVASVADHAVKLVKNFAGYVGDRGG